MVFLGGGCGSIGRWGLSLWIKRFAAEWGGFPIHTLAANFAGCLIIGLCTAWLAKQPNASLALLLVTGFCGGFTTFSTFSLESLSLLRSGNLAMGLLYMAASLCLCIAATALGLLIIKN